VAKIEVMTRVMVDATRYNGDCFFLPHVFGGTTSEVDKAFQAIESRIVELERKLQVPKDAFRYELSRLTPAVMVYAPTHPGWHHMPMFVLMTTNLDGDPDNE
jgi:hypothetical protein